MHSFWLRIASTSRMRHEVTNGEDFLTLCSMCIYIYIYHHIYIYSIYIYRESCIYIYIYHYIIIENHHYIYILLLYIYNYTNIYIYRIIHIYIYIYTTIYIAYNSYNCYGSKPISKIVRSYGCSSVHSPRFGTGFHQSPI